MAITNAVGFTYRYDEKIDQYAHAAGMTILTPEGRSARYFFGIEYSRRATCAWESSRRPTTRSGRWRIE